MPPARAKGTPPSLTPKARAYLWWLSTHQIWAESVHWFGLQRVPIDICNFLQSCTWHLPHATDRSATDTIVLPPLQRMEQIFACLDRTIRSNKGQNVWTYRHTYLQTYRPNIGPTALFQRPARGNLRTKLSMLTHWNILLHDFGKNGCTGFSNILFFDPQKTTFHFFKKSCPQK